MSAPIPVNLERTSASKRHHDAGTDTKRMLDVATAFSHCAAPHGNRGVIVAGSSGGAVWMADMLSAQGLETPVLEEEVQAVRSVGYGRLVEIVHESSRIDTIVAIGPAVRRPSWPVLRGAATARIGDVGASQVQSSQIRTRPR